MFGYVNFDVIVQKLEEVVESSEPLSDIYRLYTAICKRFGSLKKALLNALACKNIKHYITNKNEIFFRNEKESQKLIKIMQTAADLLGIKIRVEHEELDFEVVSSVSKKLKLSDPIVLQLSEEESELDDIFNSFRKVSK